MLGRAGFAFRTRRPLHKVAVVDLRIPCKVLGDGLGRDVLDLDACFAELFRIGLEAPEVAGEDADAVMGEEPRDTDQELCMVPLYVPGGMHA